MEEERVVVVRRRFYSCQKKSQRALHSCTHGKPSSDRNSSIQIEEIFANPNTSQLLWSVRRTLLLAPLIFKNDCHCRELSGVLQTLGYESLEIGCFQLHNPPIIFLSKIKSSSSSFISSSLLNLGFRKSHIVPAIGFSGGICFVLEGPFICSDYCF